MFQAYNEKELTRDMLAAFIDKVVIRSGNEIEIFGSIRMNCLIDAEYDTTYNGKGIRNMSQ